MKIGTLFASNPHVFALFPHLEIVRERQASI
jgi:hypothetical protein